MIRDPSKLYDALTLISEGVTRPTAIAKALGIVYRTYTLWMVRSNSGDPEFMVEYQGEQMQWAAAIKLATKLAALELRGMVLQESVFGVEEVQIFQGQVVWQLDPEACKWDEDTREMLGFRRDGLLERDGKLVPVTIRKPAPWAQRQRILEANFADMRPSQTITNNVNLSGAVGVGFVPKPNYSAGPPPVPPPPPMPLLENVTDAEVTDIDDDDFLGPEPAPAAAPINIILDVKAPPEERIIRDMPTAAETPAAQSGILTPPRAFDAPPPRPARSPLEQSLYDALETARQKRDGG
ncbi:MULTISPECIES: hypothetical protein [Bradyrhizobium]|uniref:Uncharacterized protein n=2 Tax=Bradyrhizobium TaxID=374 RepID=A0ABY0PJX1_9BRAD|nr:MULTISPECIES: hypothetical protein [Bradyrhizobium]SDI54629.1 hypothetical protein SAMN05444163_3090 [Bradyrhizobium ottawaense]SED42759.1 hypothetical protein SAMN05444171_4079 [Bradyrhizobium lablabi]